MPESVELVGEPLDADGDVDPQQFRRQLPRTVTNDLIEQRTDTGSSACVEPDEILNYAEQRGIFSLASAR